MAIPADDAGAEFRHTEKPTAAGTGDPAPEAADRANDSRPEITTGAEALGIPDGSQTQKETGTRDQAETDASAGIEKVLARAGVSSGSIAGHTRTALAHGYTERDLSDLWEETATQSNVKNPTGLFLTKIKAGDRASGAGTEVFEGPNADLHQVLHGLGMSSTDRDQLIDEFGSGWHALHEQFDVDPGHAIQECLAMFGGSGDSPQDVHRILREHTTDMVSILAAGRLGNQGGKVTTPPVADISNIPPVVTQVRLLLQNLSVCTRQERQDTILKDLTAALTRAEKTLTPEWSDRLRRELSDVASSIPVDDTPISPPRPDYTDINLTAEAPDDNSPTPDSGLARVELETITHAS